MCNLILNTKRERYASLPQLIDWTLVQLCTVIHQKAPLASYKWDKWHSAKLDQIAEKPKHLWLHWWKILSVLVQLNSSNCYKQN